MKKIKRMFNVLEAGEKLRCEKTNSLIEVKTMLKSLNGKDDAEIFESEEGTVMAKGITVGMAKKIHEANINKIKREIFAIIEEMKELEQAMHNAKERKMRAKLSANAIVKARAELANIYN